ncbi:MAG: hypothetical protein J6S00_07240, partial [Clostridia bacterium]|nr:hypothetical protein [Clostridia bacterium]
NGDGKNVDLIANQVTCPLSLNDEITYKFYLPNVLFAPIQKGEKIGTADVYCNGKLFTSNEIYAKNSVEVLVDNKIQKIINEFLNIIRSF